MVQPVLFPLHHHVCCAPLCLPSSEVSSIRHSFVVNLLSDMLYTPIVQTNKPLYYSLLFWRMLEWTEKKTSEQRHHLAFSKCIPLLDEPSRLEMTVVVAHYIWVSAQEEYRTASPRPFIHLDGILRRVLDTDWSYRELGHRCRVSISALDCKYKYGPVHITCSGVWTFVIWQRHSSQQS